MNTTGTLYFVQTDYLGSILALTNESGSITQRFSYDAWGRPRNPNDWTDYTVADHWLKRGFTGHEHLDAFGLINMNGRLYDPMLGRMLSPDNFATNTTQGLNRYSYALNNPLKFVDPSGQFGVEVGIAIAATILVGKMYHDGVKNNDGEYNPVDWDWGNATYTAGYSNKGGSETYSAGVGWGNNYSTQIGYNSSSGNVSFGYNYQGQNNMYEVGYEEPIMPNITPVLRPEYYDKRFYHGTENEAISILVASSKINLKETAMYDTQYGFYFEQKNGYIKQSLSKPYVGNDSYDIIDGFYIINKTNTLSSGTAWSAYKTGNFLYVYYGYNQKIQVNSFYHVHYNNTPLGEYDPFQDIVKCWAVGWDGYKRGANILDEVIINGN
jgi:RHS repeat-associated protein